MLSLAGGRWSKAHAVHLRIEDAEGRAALGPGVAQGEVGVADQLVGIDPVLGDGDADGAVGEAEDVIEIARHVARRVVARADVVAIARNLRRRKHPRLQLARELHPDVSDAPDADERFREVVDAVGAGAIWLHVYDTVTTKAGRYVQGGGCTSVAVAGLVQSGGFGSFSKGFGTAAAGLLEAEVVTADARVLTVNACSHPELFWALKGGGGGSWGVVTRLTLRTLELPEFFGAAWGTIRAQTDTAFRKLLARFFDFYASDLLNPHWGEQVTVGSDNSLKLSMVCQGLDPSQARAVWQPLFDWIAASPGEFTVTDETLRQMAGTENPRLRQIGDAAVKHMHAFAREVNLTPEEWLLGIQFLTAVGQKCSPLRQEFILLSDVLGLSAVVNALHDKKARELGSQSSLLGPFFREGVQVMPIGSQIVEKPTAEEIVVYGRVTNTDGAPLANALIQIWQTSARGLYDLQERNGESMDMRGTFLTGEDGTYYFRTVRPLGYSIPMDGPVFDRLSRVAAEVGSAVR